MLLPFGSLVARMIHEYVFWTVCRSGSRDVCYVLSYYKETYINMYIPESIPGVKLRKFDKTVSVV